MYNIENRNSKKANELVENYMCYIENLFNMTTVMIPRDKFYLDANNSDKFFDEYTLLIKENDFYSSFTQIPNEYSMLVVDVDLKQELKDDDVVLPTLWNDDDVMELIMNYFDVLENNVDKKYLSCFILKKKPYCVCKGSKRYVKHGFHLAFPKIFLSLENRILTRQLVQQKTKYKLDDIEKKPWLLYGSRKSRNTGVYKIYKIFEYDNDGDLILHNDLAQYKQNYLCFNMDEEKIPATIVRMLNIWVDYRTMYVFRFQYHLKIERKIEERKIKEKKKDEKQIIPVSKIEHILSFMEKEIADDYKSWFAVGDAIHNLTNGSNDGFKLWCSFSSQSDKYNYLECERLWDKFTDKHTLGTLIYYYNQ